MIHLFNCKSFKYGTGSTERGRRVRPVRIQLSVLSWYSFWIDCKMVSAFGTYMSGLCLSVWYSIISYGLVWYDNRQVFDINHAQNTRYDLCGSTTVWFQRCCASMVWFQRCGWSMEWFQRCGYPHQWSDFNGCGFNSVVGILNYFTCKDRQALWQPAQATPPWEWNFNKKIFGHWEELEESICVESAMFGSGSNLESPVTAFCQVVCTTPSSSAITEPGW